MRQLYKLASAELCSGVTGQVMTSLMLRPPQPSDESYPLYKEEVDNIFNGLKERSRKLVEGLNKIPGITCQPADGAMYVWLFIWFVVGDHRLFHVLSFLFVVWF